MKKLIGLLIINATMALYTFALFSMDTVVQGVIAGIVMFSFLLLVEVGIYLFIC